MIGASLSNGFIDFSNTTFHCPHCFKDYNDDNDTYLNRCNRNKSGITTIKCTCGKRFYMTYDTFGDARGFK